MHHQGLPNLPSIFFSNLCTSPHPVIIFLSQAPSGLAWPGLVLIHFLSSPLPSLQSFLHSNLGWHFQNAHTTNCSSSQLQLWFQDFSACHWPQDKDQNKAPKTLTLLLHPPSSLGTFSLTSEPQAPGLFLYYFICLNLSSSSVAHCCLIIPLSLLNITSLGKSSVTCGQGRAPLV